MATYKGIKGVKVETKASDPTASEADGTVWYNSTGATLKYAIAGAGAWASGGNMTTARHYVNAARNAPQSASLVFAGYNSGARDETEKYNGTAWTEVNDLNTARAGPGGSGTQTAALCMSGTPYSPDSNARTSNVEEFNGTSWSEKNNVVTASAWMGSLGTNTAAMMIAGDSGGGTATTMSQTWNGTSWTEGNNLVSGAVAGNSSTGSTTAGLNAGAESAPYKACQTYNGTSWTEVNNTNLNHSYATMFGTNTSAILAGDYPASTPVEEWDGTSWAAVATLATGRFGLAGTGTANSGVVMGGGPSPQDVTEEWTSPVYTIKTVTVS